MEHTGIKIALTVSYKSTLYVSLEFILEIELYSKKTAAYFQPYVFSNLVRLRANQQFDVPKNYKLVAAPLFEIYDNRFG